MSTRIRKRHIALVITLALSLSACGPGPADQAGPPIDEHAPTPATTEAPTPRPPPAPTREPVPTQTERVPTQPDSTPPPPPPPPRPPDAAGRSIPSGLWGTEWSTLPTQRKVVALTFDAGANADGVPSIMRTLAAEGVPATFFLTGRWIESYPAYTRDIGRLYTVGNHSYSHPSFTSLNDAQLRTEVLRTQELIATQAGRDARPWFRFPFGDRDARTIGVVNDLGYGSIRWTTDTLGWKGTSGGINTQTVVQRVLNDLRPGSIVLMHVGSHPTDGSTLDADALPTLIRELRARGYGFVELDDFLD